MQLITKKTMRQVRRRLNRVVGLHVSACGYDDEIKKATEAQIDLEDIIEAELDRLAVAAGEL